MQAIDDSKLETVFGITAVTTAGGVLTFALFLYKFWFLIMGAFALGGLVLLCLLLLYLHRNWRR